MIPLLNPVKMTALQTADQQLAAITELGEQARVVLCYFDLFNLGEYQQVADLFATEGSLFPPFESPVIGVNEIANYLMREADGMTVSLLSAEMHSREDGRYQIDVRGKVTSLVFRVNVAWCFMLTGDSKIESVRVNLVATLEELLKLRPE